jgi:hypothetical protein
LGPLFSASSLDIGLAALIIKIDGKRFDRRRLATVGYDWE